MKESFKGLCNLNEDELKALLENSKTSIGSLAKACG